MSILETITSLNQEASAARASTEVANAKISDRSSKKLPSQQNCDGGIERERNAEDVTDGEIPPCNSTEESSEVVANGEDVNLCSPSEESKTVSKEVNSLVSPSKEVIQESDEQKNKLTDKGDRKPENWEKKKERKEKLDKKLDHLKKNDDVMKPREEKTTKDKEAELLKHTTVEKNSSKSKANEFPKAGNGCSYCLLRHHDRRAWHFTEDRT